MEVFLMVNRVSGPARQGYRGGRVPAYPEGTQVWPLQIRPLSDEHYAKAIVLGSGNAAQGVRIALDRATLNESQAGAPRTRMAAEDWIALRKIKARLGMPYEDNEDDEDAAPLPPAADDDLDSFDD
jgi:hypothetical protein